MCGVEERAAAGGTAVLRHVFQGEPCETPDPGILGFDVDAGGVVECDPAFATEIVEVRGRSKRTLERILLRERKRIPRIQG